MLVLTRKINQGIVIAGNIYIRVLGVERDRVKIGIAASGIGTDRSLPSEDWRSPFTVNGGRSGVTARLTICIRRRSRWMLATMRL